MVRTRPAFPEGHGEVVERPAYRDWAGLLADNRERAGAWQFEFAGLSARALRREARADILSVGEKFSARLGILTRSTGGVEGAIVATGHQPDLYHPGVWVKDFLLERLARETGAAAVDVVVDSDGFDSVAVSAPCMQPGLARCRQYLSVGVADTCFAFAPVPDDKQLAEFCSSGDEMLATLPAPAVRRHFSAFCNALSSAAPESANLAELLTIARRRYEASASTAYLEAPLTTLAGTRSFRRFVVGLALDASRFVHAYNVELEQYRSLSKTRSAAQPFPNLGVEEDRIELPFWHLERGHRRAVWVEHLGDGGSRLTSDNETIAELPAGPAAAVDALERSGALLAPKALALTLYVRLLCCDLFIHGIGGGRYDMVTDGVIRRYFGVEPPAFVVASMTMYLPLGAHTVGDEEVSAAKERLNRIEHNPDSLLGDVEFDNAGERGRAIELAEEKADLVARIAKPGADKKALGMRIRAVNAELAGILAPLRESLEAELASLELQRAASEILTDRTYPYCFWDPMEIADKVW